MRKVLLVALGAAVLALHGGSASALTTAHMSSATGATQGDCSKCHIPHKALGAQRLFPIAIGTTSQGTLGFMGSMCAEYCHQQAGTLPRAYAGNTALQTPGTTNTSNSSHGLNLQTAAMPPDTVVAATLPYGNGSDGIDALGTAGSFECTTCHDPHKNATSDTSQALLQEDIDTLCDTCHTQRGGGDAAWAGYGPTNDAGTTSSHPVGTNVTGDNDAAGNSPIDIGGTTAPGSTSFDVAYGVSGDHNLGGHMYNGGLANTAAVTCASCHAVHGSQADTAGATSQPPAPSGPFEDLLVVAQGVMGTTEPNRTANGGNGNDAENALCSGCHMQSSGNEWNPGGTAYSHPANGQTASFDWGAIVAPTGWPTGSGTTTADLSVMVICETCHDPHGAVVNTHILRTTSGGLCGSCHIATAAGHHPVGAMAPFTDDAIALQDGDATTLTCGDCHSGTSGSAHNWIAAGGGGMPLSSNWEPANNGRGADQAAEDFVTNTSKECIDCHTNAGARNNPVDAARDAGSLEATGNASHYLGSSTDADVDLSAGRRADGTTVFNTTNQTWTRGGWSRYGGADATSYEIVCESCHELQMSRNANSPRLLLEAFVELEDVNHNALCVGCHGVVPGGTSVHPLTGQTVSAAADQIPARSPVTLITAGTGYADAAGAPNNAEYPATANRMTCDSCHQVHMADTPSGSFILEYGATGGGGLAASVASGVSIAAHDADATQGINHAVLCTQCHNY